MALHTIKVKKHLDVILERVAAGTITPGMLIEITSANKVQAHSTAKGAAHPRLFALEDELQGNGIDVNYSTDNLVQVWVAVDGEIVYGILKDGENVAIGDWLESAGDGTLQKYTNGVVIGQVVEAVDLSGSVVATGRVKVLIG